MKTKLVLIPAVMLMMTACSTGTGTGEISSPEALPAQPGSAAGKWTLKDANGEAGFIFDGMLDQPEIPCRDVVHLELRENGEAYFSYPVFGYDDTMLWSTFADAMRRNDLDPDNPAGWSGTLSDAEAVTAKDYLEKNAVTVFRSETNWIFAGQIYYIPPDQPELLISCGDGDTCTFESAAEFPAVPEELSGLYRTVQEMQGAWGCDTDAQTALTVTGCKIETYRGSPDAAETMHFRYLPDHSLGLDADGSSAGTLALLEGKLIRTDTGGSTYTYSMISDEAFRTILYGEASTDEE